mmetsp:Transcript_5563/g.13445  ORF Transcript_5563/g.13445 Transcript_5563/m.13445 type:complete len:163 (-) Transcript_5563:224-712(-)
MTMENFSWSWRSRMNFMMMSVVAVSRSPVGSSISSKSGLFASALAIVTLCCSPPDICAGIDFALCVIPTFSSKYIARLLRSLKPSVPASTSGSSTFPSAVSVGSRLNAWNTKPIRNSRMSASAASFVASETRVPKRYKSPLVCLSIVPSTDSNVDFPQPDVP